MKYVAVALLALLAGAFIAREIWVGRPEPVDPLQVIVTQLKTHAIIEHERQVAVWYRTCPDVLGIDPQIFVAWPAKLTYELPLGDVALERDGTRLRVRTSVIGSDEPAVPTDFVDYLSTDSLFNFANEHELVNGEIRKASRIARYLSTYFMMRDPSLREDFRHELEALVRRLAGALGVEVTSVEVEIPSPKVSWPKLPGLELCAGSVASVNGLPFARLEGGRIVPLGFRPVPSARSVAGTRDQPAAVPRGIASVYGGATGR